MLKNISTAAPGRYCKQSLRQHQDAANSHVGQRTNEPTHVRSSKINNPMNGTTGARKGLVLRAVQPRFRHARKPQDAMLGTLKNVQRYHIYYSLMNYLT